MSSCTQFTLLSRSTRSLSYCNQLSSGRQSVSSLSPQANHGRLASVVLQPNPLSLQPYRPFSIANPLSLSNFKPIKRSKQTSSPPQQERPERPSTAQSVSSTESSTSSSDYSINTMSNHRLKQLKQVYSSNLYLFQCLAFIGFVLLTIRLYEVNKDINYLRHVSSAWLPNITIVPSVNTPVAESVRVSTTVSMFTDKVTDQSSPLASPLTSSLTPSSFDDEEEDNEESESRITTQSIKFINDSSAESLPQAQALQFRSRTTSRTSTTNGLSTRTNGLTSPSSSTTNSASSTNGLSSSGSTSNTTPLSTQIDNIQREIDLAKARSAFFHVENLRKDVDSLIVDMWSSRTTLMLSLVFIVVYIISFGWLAHAVSETKHPKDVTLKTVLLLAVFSSIDIAASAGFVMVRLILYSMKDNQFANEMRIPSALNEYQQLTAFSALRFAALRSTSGSIDIFASLIISFFIFIRIYNVIQAMTFYQRIRKIYSQEKHRSIATLNEIGSPNKDYDDLFKRINFINKENSLPLSPAHLQFNNGLNSSTLLNPMNQLNQNLLSPTLNPLNLNNMFNQTAAKSFNLNPAAANLAATLQRQKNLGQTDHRRFSTATSLLSDDEQVDSILNNLNSNATNLNNDDPAINTVPLKTNESVESQIKILASDMDSGMKKKAIKSLKNALQLYTTEKYIAESIKQDFDNEFGATWHCITGRNWSSCIGHGSGCYIRMSYKDLTILLYKST